MRAEQHREERQRQLARRSQMKNDRLSQIRINREETEVRKKQELETELESKQAKANALRRSHLQEVGRMGVLRLG